MLENHNLDLFLMEMGILEKKTDLEYLEDVLDPRYICLQKGYFRTPYDENGEVSF